jgi:hypothetical protein
MFDGMRRIFSLSSYYLVGVASCCNLGLTTLLILFNFLIYQTIIYLLHPTLLTP